jgi:L-alanine-DL-glutamate epimerase-like enolase superfamily enzyme
MRTQATPAPIAPQSRVRRRTQPGLPLAAPFEVKDGMVTVPDRPGNGIEWDEAAVKRLQRA